MTRRSRAREVALQLLFWRDANPTASADAVDRFVKDRLHDATVEPFARHLFDGVVGRQAEIDALLTATAENWRLSRMAAVDRNVLRIGVFELLDQTDPVPPAVTIDEAIELARRYSGAESAAFVNGILDQCRIRIENPVATEAPAPDPEPEINPQSEISNPQ
jgi:N utilization substance protein B